MFKTAPAKTLGRALLTCAGVLAVAGVAHADSITVNAAGDSVRQIPVAYYDLNLTNPAGQARLYQRIDIAVRRACGFGMGSALENLPASQACLVDAQRAATAQADAAIASARSRSVISASR